MLESLFSVVFYFLLGYVARVFKIIDENGSQILIKFIIYFSFPALVVYNIYNLKFSTEILMIVAFGWFFTLFSIFVLFAVGKMLRLKRETLATFVMMGTFSNTSFLGFPFTKAVLGLDYLKYSIIFDQLVAFLSVSILSPFLIAYGKNERGKLEIKRIITFPPFIALVAGFVLSAFYIPNFILQTLKDLGMTTLPLALFAVGINLKLLHIKTRLKDISLVLMFKLVILPLIAILFAKLIFNPLPEFMKAVILEISMPPMVLASIFVMDANLDKELAIGAVGFGIIASFFTVPLIMMLL